eukprot:TRINITY_DN63277_c0_g1_i1.p2 TRINITY_DN63277_c0_g1~~TRINITY_DN63277_c0_g1_i1.p2  ORF type:complete len:107 (+),score=12.10 TRINITY_DN63277_c0_g1_i1:63-383(+)
MAQCFSGCAKVLGLGVQRRDSAICGDACAGSVLDKADSAESLQSCSTGASTLEAKSRRKRDMLRQFLFGGGKRDWITRKLGFSNAATVLEHDAVQEEGKDICVGAA